MHATNTQVTTSDLPQADRRSFLNKLIGGSFLVLLGGTLYPILRFLWPSQQTSSAGAEWQEVATTDELLVGQGKIVTLANQPVYVVRLHENEYKALSAICTHLGCIVKWGLPEHPDHFFCPCHAAVFDTFGNVLAGPAPRPLPSFQVKVSEGKVLLKT